MIPTLAVDALRLREAWPDAEEPAEGDDGELAHAGHYPAVDVLQSVSRLVSEVTAPEVREAGIAARA